ncbi:hypothetical protein [Companilactobacillus nodensis]|nr:hypothetical protein [Companilactobacillus nodensis]
MKKTFDKRTAKANPWFSGEYNDIDFEEMKDAMDIPMDGGNLVGKEIA